MNNTRVFTGAGTAIVTPMRADGSVDFEAFGRLIDWQIAEGIDAIIAMGTTGECATLNDDEHIAVIDYAVQRVAGRVPVIGGTGSNDSAHGLNLTRRACNTGVDAILAVTPYYNKTTQKGLIRYFYDYADAATAPIILYNVPSRTGLNIAPETCEVLANHENIVGIKEASGNIAQVAEIMARCEGRLDLYSGNDDQIIPLLSLGGVGVISVLSNVLPRETSAMVHAYLDGNTEEARREQLRYMNLIRALFREVNPIPVKAATSLMGYGENVLRTPLVPMEEEHLASLIREMREIGVIA